MEQQTPLVGRVRSRLRAAARRQPIHRPRQGRVASWLVVVLAGLMMSATAVASRGTDIRPDRNNDLTGLVQQQARGNREQAERVAALRAEVDEATRRSKAGTKDTLGKALTQTQVQAAMTKVKGPAVKVTLTDAPLSVKPEGVDGDLLVVHQQDIQMVANVLWGAGAEAMTIQGQRVTSMTGIKCVGNTVVLHGVPYAPPYEIVAIGDQDALKRALDTSREVSIYKQYVDTYHLGWSDERLDEVTMPAFSGSLELKYVR